MAVVGNAVGPRGTTCSDSATAAPVTAVVRADFTWSPCRATAGTPVVAIGKSSRMGGEFRGVLVGRATGAYS